MEDALRRAGLPIAGPPISPATPPSGSPLARSWGGSRAAWSAVRAPWAIARSWLTRAHGSRRHDSTEKIKHREPFRPFAPSALLERAGDYFASDYPSPVMLLVFDVLEHRRAEVPAITHVDGTARVQTVSRAENPMYWELIKAFEEITGVPMVVNTSFNDNEEPIVCTPSDAMRCFLKTGLDGLALGPFWVDRPAASAEQVA